MTQSFLPSYSKGKFLIHDQFFSVIVLIGKVFMMISKMFHERIHLIWMLLLLPCNFVTRIKLELIYIWSKRSILVHLGGFHLLMCQPVAIEKAFAVCTNRWNILCQWLSLDKILFVVKGLLSLPNFLILVKQGVYCLDIFYFWQIMKSVLSSTSYKEDCSAETVFENWLTPAALYCVTMKN